MKMARRSACEQAAVVPFRVRRGLVEVALITTADKKRWILPKGWIDDGEAPEESALREAHEEAGLLGRVVGAALGYYEYAKADGRRAVAVFLMRVTSVRDSWPEDHRRRRWVPIEEAEEHVDGADLRRVVQRARRRLRRA
ncbi:MAG TPA: NUDIX hydrolase [Planctomycetota bacterium]|nr:NUDIX hydrolase [Planctomycetota bacterium]